MKLITVGNFGKVSQQREFIKVFEDFDDSIQCFIGKNQELFIIHNISDHEMVHKVIKEFEWMGYFIQSTGELDFCIK